MQLLNLKPVIHKLDTFGEFAKEFNLNEKDLLITNEFIYKPYMEALGLKCNFIFQEKYGLGEPSDEMMNAILAEAKKKPFERVIAVGGGTIIDTAKLFCLKGVDDVVKAFERSIPIVKEKTLLIVPTTCGTGSEVTNISIAEIKSKHTKIGLAADQILADSAILIPELLKGLPWKPYICASIDALVHATESFVSPKANYYTRVFSKSAAEMILKVFKVLAKDGQEARHKFHEEMLVASNFAGIAFGNAGVGAVHALSYPLGGTYHVPHGESNYQLYTAVFDVYLAKQPKGSIEGLNRILADNLGCSTDKVYVELDNLLSKLLAKNKLRTYGMTEADIDGFSDNVLKTQQRLLNNNYVPLSREEIRGIYQRLW